MSLYWKCQLVGWSGMAAWGLLTLFVWADPNVRDAGATVAYSVVGLGATHLLRAVARPREWVTLPFSRLGLRMALASLAVGGVMQSVALLALASDIPTDVNWVVHLLAQWGQGTIIILGWLLAYFGFQFHRRSKDAEESEWRLRVAMQETELGALRAQLNPHFLFNSLNSLRALISEDPPRAQKAVTTLARLLRHTVSLSRSPTVRLGDEVEAARSYLELEEIRFDERLSHHFRVPEDLRDQRVPPMLLQTLVENAVKHGIARLPQGGSVSVEATEEGGSVVLQVTNPGTLVPEEEGARGIGLANAREQLHLLFGAEAGLELHQEDDEEERVVCRVTLPRQHASETRDGPTEGVGPTEPTAEEADGRLPAGAES